MGHDVVAEHDHERIVPNVLAGHRDRMPQTQRFALTHEVNVGQVGEVDHLTQLVHLALGLQQVLQLEVAIEVVLQAAFVTARDDEDVIDSGGDRLLNHILDGRSIDHRQHLLGLRLGGGRKRVPNPAAGITALVTRDETAVLIANSLRPEPKETTFRFGDLTSARYRWHSTGESASAPLEL